MKRLATSHRYALAASCPTTVSPPPQASQPPETAPRTGTCIRPGLHGVFRVGGMVLALPIEAIREVTPRPAELVGFPSLRADISGAIELRGSIIPVMDIGAVLGTPAGAGPVVLVMRAGGGVLGLFIDSICGVVHLDDRALSPLTTTSASIRAIAAGFVYNDLRGALLDPESIAALPDLPVTTDHAVDRSGKGDGGGDPVLLFSCGEAPLGIAARAVEAAIPLALLIPPVVDDPLWIGLLDYNGRHIPVVDTLGLLGIGSLSRPLACASVIIRMPEGRLVALALDAVCDMQRVRDEDVLPLQRFRLGERQLMRGLHQSDRAYILLDDRAIASDARLGAISRIEERAVAEPDVPMHAMASTAARAEPFLVVAVAGECCAIPLPQVEEILPAPSHAITLATKGGPDALFSHRGRGVPLIDLAASLGLSRSARTPAFAVLAQHGGDRMGFLIEDLVAVERVPLQRLAGATASHRVPSATIRLPDGRTAAVIDLATLIDAERNATAAAAAA